MSFVFVSKGNAINIADIKSKKCENMEKISSHLIFYAHVKSLSTILVTQSSIEGFCASSP